MNNFNLERTIEFLTVLIFIILLSWAFSVGWESIGSWMGRSFSPSITNDTTNVVNRSLTVALTGELHPFDPPLRYIPLATIYYLTGATGVLAEKIANTYFAIMSFVAIPITMYTLFRSIGNKLTAFLTVLGFLVWRLAGLGVIAYYDGVWQYSQVIPLILLAIWSAHKMQSSFLRYSVLTGILIGIIGLNQYVYAMHTICIVVISTILNKKYRELTVSGLTASAFIPILLLPDRLLTYALKDGTSRIGGPEDWEPVFGLINLITTPSYLFILSLFIFVFISTIYINRFLTKNRMIESSIIILMSFWLAGIILVHPQWFTQLSHMPLQYILLGAVICKADQIANSIDKIR
jgi:hypothetical protein